MTPALPSDWDGAWWGARRPQAAWPTEDVLRKRSAQGSSLGSALVLLDAVWRAATHACIGSLRECGRHGVCSPRASREVTPQIGIRGVWRL